MKFLFWNIKQKSLGSTIFEMVVEHNLDWVILAECNDSVQMQILNDLNTGKTNKKFHVVDTGKTKVKILTLFPPQFIKSVYNENYLTIQRVFLPQRQEILLAAIHFKSLLNTNEDEQSKKLERISKDIREVEQKTNLSRTILVGDLNLNPFAKAMIAADGLHAVMTREKAKMGKRSVGSEEYPFFYNPMWGRLGDSSNGPPGTYYFDKSRTYEYFWHMVDQVLLRPELLESFDNDSLKILTKVRNISLVRASGRPNDSSASDHLPLLFELKV